MSKSNPMVEDLIRQVDELRIKLDAFSTWLSGGTVPTAIRTEVKPAPKPNNTAPARKRKYTKRSAYWKK